VFEVHIGDVADGLERRHLCEQLWRRGETRAPAVPAAAAPAPSPGPSEAVPNRARAGTAAEATFLVTMPLDGRAGPIAWWHSRAAPLSFPTRSTVQRATLEQLRVGALVHDAAGVDDDDAVGQVQGRAAVGDEQRRPATHDRAQGAVDGLFHLGVDSTRGVVEQQDPRIAEQGPGEGDPLALSA